MCRTLQHLGIDVQVRTVDPAQYQHLTDDFDFDMTMMVYPESDMPGQRTARLLDLRRRPRRRAATTLPGVCDPVVDALVEKVITAPDRDDADHRGARAGPRAAVGLVHGAATGTVASLPRRLLGSLRPSRTSRSARASISTPGGSTRQARGKPTPTRRAADGPMAHADGGLPVRRLLLVIPTLFGIIAINFVVVQFAPGGPVEQMIAELRGQGGMSLLASAAPARDIRRRRRLSRRARARPAHRRRHPKMFGFDKPPLTRFLDMVGGYLRFDFGRSFFRDQTVLQLIAQKMPVSISLGLWSTLLVYLISIPLGIAKAVRDGSRFDVASSAVVLVGYAVPGFLFAILLVVLFAGGSFFQWFPLRGLTSEGAATWSWPRAHRRLVWHMVLPTIAVVAGGFASLTMLTKNCFLEEIRKQYTVTARAKGASEQRVLYGHVFRNAMLLIVAGFPRRSSASCSPRRCWWRSCSRSTGWACWASSRRSSATIR